MRKWFKKKYTQGWHEGYKACLRGYEQQRIRESLSAADRKRAVADLPDIAGTVYHFMCDPSNREIAAAIGMPKSTVHDAIKILRANNLNSGSWSL